MSRRKLSDTLKRQITRWFSPKKGETYLTNPQMRGQLIRMNRLGANLVTMRMGN